MQQRGGVVETGMAALECGVKQAYIRCELWAAATLPNSIVHLTLSPNASVKSAVRHLVNFCL